MWRATVSNYGHQQRIPVRVLSVGPKRVYVETQYQDGKPERRVRVKPENLFPAVGGVTCSSGEDRT
jgi:hypothetical protein